MAASARVLKGQSYPAQILLTSLYWRRKVAYDRRGVQHWLGFREMRIRLLLFKKRPLGVRSVRLRR